MKNRAVLNLTFTAFAIVFCSVLFPLSAKGSDTDYVTGGDVEELRLREDVAVREVNEGTLAEIEKVTAARRTRYIDEELGYAPKGNLLSDDELAAIEKQRVEKEKAVRARYGYDINSLRQEESGVSQEQPGDISRKPATSKSVPRGTVTGIVLYNNKGAVLVAGKIARENDTVLGVKVVKILPDYVEFEKRGKTWKQEVGQPPPDSVWEAPAPAKQSSPAQRSTAVPKAKTSR